MTTHPITSPAVLAGRVAWMLAGPLFLAAVALFIALEGGGWLTRYDVFYFAILAVMLLGRWVESRSGEAVTSTGEPATAADFRRYMLMAPVVAMGIWVVVNFVGNHWPGG